MFCPECGSKNEDNAVFCNNCGMRLQEAGVENLSAPEKKREPLSSGDKILLAELGVAILSVIIFIVVYNMQYSGKNTVEKHIKAFFEQDWNTVYDTMYIEEPDDFMSKESFLTAQKINASGEKEHADISINKVSGGFSSQAYYVTYRTKDYSDSMTVELKRKGLVWKVNDSADYTVKNYMVSVPSGADVSVDKIDISRKLKPSEKMEGYDTYTIPKVFGTEHYVELSGEELETTGQLLESYGSEDPEENLQYSIVKTGYNEETIEKVMKQAETDIEEILNAACENKRFSEVGVFEEMYSENKEYVIDAYEGLRDDTFGNSNSKYTLTSYKITNGEMNGSLPDYYEDSVVEVDIKGNYEFSNAYIYWDGDVERDNGDGTCEHSLYYINQGGTWKLYDMDIDMGGVY